MANELVLNIKASYAKSGALVTFPDTVGQQLSITVAGTRYITNRQSVGTAEEALELGDLSTGGYFIAINRDSTNFVSIRAATGATALVRLNAGEACAFRLSSAAAAPFAIADTAAVELEYLLLSA